MFLEVIASQDNIELVIRAQREAVYFSLNLPAEDEEVKLTCLNCCFSCCDPSKLVNLFFLLFTYKKLRNGKLK